MFRLSSWDNVGGRTWKSMESFSVQLYGMNESPRRSQTRPFFDRSSQEETSYRPSIQEILFWLC